MHWLHVEVWNFPLRQHEWFRVSCRFVVPIKKIIVTIDGPAGAGKSTTARRVAHRLGYLYIDSGAMYRAVTLAALRESTSLDDESLGELANRCDIHMEPGYESQAVFLNGEDVSLAIRQSNVTGSVSQVSAFPRVRRALVQRQRSLGLLGGVVMDGRDIGSVVFPNAEVKVFFTADTEERIKRRLSEAIERGESIAEDEVRQQILGRDKIDSEREDSPLVKPAGATEVDTTRLTMDEQVERILELVSQCANF